MVGPKAERVAPWKQEVVDELSELLDRYPIAGVLDISSLPASQFQQIRRKLRGQAEIVVAKNTLINLSIQRASERKDPKIRELTSFLGGQSALIFSAMNPFKLSKFLRENKINAPAKPGSRSVRDVVIPAGETEFAPGPVVAELQRVGIKARIQAGKVVILEDCKLLKEGDVISKEVSDILAKFGILPLELGLKLRAAYERGMIFSGGILEYDERKALEEVQSAWRSAFNLAINVDHPTSATIGIMISKAFTAAQNLALNACLPVPQVVPALLARSRVEMLGLAAAVGAKNPHALDEELRAMLGVAPPAEPEPEEKPREESESKARVDKPEEKTKSG